jgi:hypothetical protein
MARPRSIKSLLKRLPPHRSATLPGPSKSKDELARLLYKPLKRAFADAGLDMHKTGDWIILAMRLAAVVYRGRSPGQPKRWTKKWLKKLAEDIDKIKHENQKLKELECCRFLIKRSEGKLYNGVGVPATLRRRLQEAKRLKKASSAGPRADLAKQASNASIQT